MSTSTFSWLQSTESQERSNPGRRRIQAPASVDTSELMAANEDLLIGLFEGTYPGLKLASALVYPIIFVPVSFMGMPTPTSEDPKTQELLNEIMAEIRQPLQKVFMRRAIVGTSWIWPNWDARTQSIVYEIIPDKCVSAIIKDQDTGRVVQIITDEQMTVQIGENQTGNVRRKRHFTPQSVRVEWTGETRGMIMDKSSRNPSGIMPIPFANDVLDNGVRGVGYLQRILADLKNYHDTDYKWSKSLHKSNPKLVQYVSSDPQNWMDNNPQLGTLEDMDPEEADFILNLEGKERTEYLTAKAEYAESFAIKQNINFAKIVEGSKTPELLYGLLATGNHASVETDMTSLARSMQDDRNQIDDACKILYAASMRLKMGGTMQVVSPEFKMGWNDFDVLSEETKAKIFDSFTAGIQKLSDAKIAVPLETIHKLFLGNFPKATEADFKKWYQQSKFSAKFKQFASASYEDAIDTEGPVMAGENSL